GHMVQQRLVGGLDLVPIDAVHVGIIEMMLHHPPAFAEHLLALSPVVDLDANREADPAAAAAAAFRAGGRPAAAAAKAAPARGRRFRGSRAGGHGRHVDARALAIVKLPAVAGVLERRQARKSAEAPRPLLLFGSRARLDNTAGHTTFERHRPDGLHTA